jgi:hypothetical protein
MTAASSALSTQAGERRSSAENATRLSVALRRLGFWSAASILTSSKEPHWTTTPASASAPAISNPPVTYVRTEAQSITKQWLVAVKPWPGQAAAG